MENLTRISLQQVHNCEQKDLETDFAMAWWVYSPWNRISRKISHFMDLFTLKDPLGVQEYLPSFPWW